MEDNAKRLEELNKQLSELRKVAGNLVQDNPFVQKAYEIPKSNDKLIEELQKLERELKTNSSRLDDVSSSRYSAKRMLGVASDETYKEGAKRKFKESIGLQKDEKLKSGKGMKRMAGAAVGAGLHALGLFTGEAGFNVLASSWNSRRASKIEEERKEKEELELTERILAEKKLYLEALLNQNQAAQNVQETEAAGQGVSTAGGLSSPSINAGSSQEDINETSKIAQSKKSSLSESSFEGILNITAEHLTIESDNVIVGGKKQSRKEKKEDKKKEPNIVKYSKTAAATNPFTKMEELLGQSNEYLKKIFEVLSGKSTTKPSSKATVNALEPASASKGGIIDKLTGMLVPKTAAGKMKLGGTVLGAGAGAYAGYKAGDWASEKLGLEEGGTASKVVKGVSSVGGAVLGGGAGYMAGKVAGKALGKVPVIGSLLGQAAARADADQNVYVTNADEIGQAVRGGPLADMKSLIPGGGPSIPGRASTGTGFADKLGSGIGTIGKGLGEGVGGFLKGLAKGLEALGTADAMKGAVSLAILGGALWVAGKGFKEFQELDWDAIAKGSVGLGALALGVAALSSVGPMAIVGAAAVAVMGGALWVAGKGFQTFAELDWATIGKGIVGVGALALGAAALSPLAPAIVIGAVALGTLGLALRAFPTGIFEGIAKAFESAGTGFKTAMEGINTLSQADPLKLIGLAGSLAILTPALLAFSVAAGAVGAVAKGVEVVKSLFGFGSKPAEGNAAQTTTSTASVPASTPAQGTATQPATQPAAETPKKKSWFGGWFADGGVFKVKEPTMIGVGEAGEETVSIMPKKNTMKDVLSNGKQIEEYDTKKENIETIDGESKTPFGESVSNDLMKKGFMGMSMLNPSGQLFKIWKGMSEVDKDKAETKPPSGGGLFSSIMSNVQNFVGGVAQTVRTGFSKGKEALLGTKYEGFGSISRLGESGTTKGDYGAVSSGKGDRGGASYGAYQFNSKDKVVGDFLKTSGYDKQFGGAQPGSPEFNNKWRELASSDPKFNEAQDSYAKSKYLQPQLQKLQKLGVNTNSPTIQEMAFSTGIQYGADSNIIPTALKASGKDPSKLKPTEIVQIVQDYKAGSTGTYFKNSSANVQQNVSDRHAGKEKKALLAMATAEESGKGLQSGQQMTGGALTPNSSLPGPGATPKTTDSVKTAKVGPKPATQEQMAKAAKVSGDKPILLGSDKEEALLLQNKSTLVQVSPTGKNLPSEVKQETMDMNAVSHDSKIIEMKRKQEDAKIASLVESNRSASTVINNATSTTNQGDSMAPILTGDVGSYPSILSRVYRY